MLAECVFYPSAAQRLLMYTSACRALHTIVETFKGDTKLLKPVLAAVKDPMFSMLSECLYLVCHAIGWEASFFNGCHCHEDMLMATTSFRKRKLAMVQELGPGGCKWKGKRLVPLSMGHMRQAVERVRRVQSFRFTQMMMNSTSAVTSRILIIRAQVTSQWAETVLAAFYQHEHIPLSVCGAFAAYQGYTLEAAKAVVKAGFEEFNAIEDKLQADLISIDLYGKSNATSEQLFEFSTTHATALHSYPEAFVAIQEYAFGPSSEVTTESMHVFTKFATKRTQKLVHISPAPTYAQHS